MAGPYWERWSTAGNCIGWYPSYEALVEAWARDLAHYGAPIVSWLLSEAIGCFEGSHEFEHLEQPENARVLAEAFTYG